MLQSTKVTTIEWFNGYNNALTFCDYLNNLFILACTQLLLINNNYHFINCKIFFEIYVIQNVIIHYSTYNINIDSTNYGLQLKIYYNKFRRTLMRNNI